MSIPKIDLDQMQRGMLQIRALPKLPPLPRVIWVDQSLPGELGHCLQGDYEWRVSEAWLDALVRQSLGRCAVLWHRTPSVGSLNVDGTTIEVRRLPGGVR
jgi:hypothetical protein